MYLKLTIFLTLFLSTFAFSETEKKPQIEFIRLSYASLEEHESVFLESVKPYGKHPIVLMDLENFPTEKRLDVYIHRPLIQDEQESVKLYEFICKEGGENYISFLTCGFLPGERIGVTIKTKDGGFVYKTNFIPNAIRGKNKKEEVLLTAELKTLNEGKCTYALDLSGFSEKEEVIFKSVSGREISEHPMVCSKNCSVLIQPVVKRQKGGVGKVSLTRKSGEVISINLPWGDNLLEYFEGKLVFDPED